MFEQAHVIEKPTSSKLGSILESEKDRYAGEDDEAVDEQQDDARNSAPAPCLGKQFLQLARGAQCSPPALISPGSKFGPRSISRAFEVFEISFAACDRGDQFLTAASESISPLKWRVTTS